jgi:Zn-dependent M28 family amino/carboxypeptidase
MPPMKGVCVRKIALAATGVLLSVGLLSPIQASAIDQINTQKLRKAVTVGGILQHERVFQNIANHNEGTRASGTPGFDASAEYVAEQLRDAGYNVQTQRFTFPFFRELAPAELSEVSPTARDIETAVLTYSGSGEVTGQVIPTNDIVIPPGPTPSTSNSGCEPGDFTPAPSGPAIALIQRGTCTFEQKADNATAAGYDAVIIFNEGQPGRQEVLQGTLAEPATIPVIGISFADGEALYNETQAGEVTARVFTSTENDPNRETVNVIADSPEGKIKDETIVVGAHLDSVTAGPGINDNGSGSATILEIAKQLAALKYTDKLERQVRFAFWGAEELVLLGSEHYVNSLTNDELTEIKANLNFDMLGSPNYVRFVYDGDGSDTPTAGPDGSADIEDIFNKYFADQGLASEPTAFDGRSDYGPFIAVGIPAGGLFSGAEGIKTPEEAAVYGGTAGEAYDECYHQACDTINNLSSKALAELGDAAAHATLTLALSKSGFESDASRARVKVTGKAAKSEFQLAK